MSHKRPTGIDWNLDVQVPPEDQYYMKVCHSVRKFQLKHLFNDLLGDQTEPSV